MQLGGGDDGETPEGVAAVPQAGVDVVGDVAFVDVDGWCEEDHLGGGGVQPVMQGDRALISGEVAVGHDGDVEPSEGADQFGGEVRGPLGVRGGQAASAVRVSASFSPSVTHSHAPVLAAR
ncbi:hypothetical protein [Mycobacterium avium]|uniref:hypothetical protein n=1 Tax=Mycobacterium avium TaxID=1764 RepID=UPI000534E958|nr:hypothetical protein [Mycobacterium avium]